MSTHPHHVATRQLSRKCPVLKRLIAIHGPCTLTPRGNDPFNLLVQCVISQQISTKAADSIYAKLAAVAGGPPVPRAALAKLSAEQLRACGLSGAKQRTLQTVAEHVAARPKFYAEMANHTDDAIREELTSLKGIGPWTVDMFLMFGLGRPDVLPVGDLGLRAGVRDEFGLPELPTKDQLEQLAEPWKPYRSIATWYIWRSRGPAPLVKKEG